MLSLDKQYHPLPVLTGPTVQDFSSLYAYHTRNEKSIANETGISRGYDPEEWIVFDVVATSKFFIRHKNSARISDLKRRIHIIRNSARSDGFVDMRVSLCGKVFTPVNIVQFDARGFDLTLIELANRTLIQSVIFLDKLSPDPGLLQHFPSVHDAYAAAKIAPSSLLAAEIAEESLEYEKYMRYMSGPVNVPHLTRGSVISYSDMHKSFTIEFEGTVGTVEVHGKDMKYLSLLDSRGL